MGNSLITLVFLAIAFGGTLLAAQSATQRQALHLIQNDPNFHTIGQVGRKTFIAYTKPGNWMAGRGACRNAGLEFATIKDCTEFDFLYSKTKSDLWISGIMRGAENGDASGFSWDSDGTTPVASNANIYMWPKHWLCLYFSGDHHSYTDFCLSGQHQTLCQYQN